MSLHQQHHTFDDLEVQHPWKQQQRPATATATTLRRQQQEAKEEEEAIHLWVEESRLLMLGLGVSSPSPPLTPAPNTAPDLFWFGGEDRDRESPLGAGIVSCCMFVRILVYVCDGAQLFFLGGGGRKGLSLVFAILHHLVFPFGSNLTPCGW